MFFLTQLLSVVVGYLLFFLIAVIGGFFGLKFRDKLNSKRVRQWTVKYIPDWLGITFTFIAMISTGFLIAYIIS